MVRAMVHSEKHIVQKSVATVLAGAVGTVDIIEGVAVVDKNAAHEVEEGSTVKAVYIEFWVRSSEVSPGSGQAILYKTSADQGTVTAVELAALNDWNNKKNILYTTQGLYNDQDADATLIGRQWFKIPKGKQRFGLGDKLKFTLSAAGAIDLLLCGVAIYKEYK